MYTKLLGGIRNMFDVNSMTAKDNMSYWFVYDRLSKGWSALKHDVSNNRFFNIRDAAVYEDGNECIVEFEAHVTESNTDSDKVSIQQAFNLFKRRPEYIMYTDLNSGLIFTDSTNSPDILAARVDAYTTYLAATMLLHGSTDAQVTRCIAWLEESGFFEGPASTRFHESYVGGLLAHSLRVMYQIMQLSKLPAFNTVDLSEAILVALTHDWCKINMYEQYKRNVKNEDTGVWVAQAAFRHKSSPTPFGHATASLYILQKFVKIRMEEALAVRWHMGRWYVADSEIDDLQRSNEQYPLVHMLQFADQLAITDYALTI